MEPTPEQTAFMAKNWRDLIRPRMLEIAWGEAGNQAMPPGATRLRVTFEAREGKTRVELEHGGLMPAEATKIGRAHV